MILGASLSVFETEGMGAIEGLGGGETMECYLHHNRVDASWGVYAKEDGWVELMRLDVHLDIDDTLLASNSDF